MNDRNRGRQSALTRPEGGLSCGGVTRLLSRQRSRFAALLLLTFLGLAGCGRTAPAHGVALVIAIDTTLASGTAEHTALMTQTEDVLRRRLDDLGIRNFVGHDADGRVVVKVASLPEGALAAVRRNITRIGRLEFRRVNANFFDPTNTAPTPGFERMTLELKIGATAQEEILEVKRIPDLTGNAVAKASLIRDAYDEPMIALTFTAEGAERFGDVTREIANEAGAGGFGRLAMVVDGTLLSAPTVRAEIRGGRAQISGNFSMSEAVELCRLLNAPLSTPRHIVEERKF